MDQKKKKLTNLSNDYKDCKNCKDCLSQVKVFGHGNVDAKICVIGEGPGKVECELGIPFTGPAGQLLDKILAAIDIKREDIYFTNSVICRTSAQNRTPYVSEIEKCKERLFRELTIVNPRYTILSGGVALRTIFGQEHKMMETHGQWITSLSEPCYFYFSLLHPAWILHSITEGETRSKKRIMWNDIKKFKESLSVLDSINWRDNNGD